MPLLNFKKQFVEPIRSGVKHHTIRAERKIPVKPGDRLYLYCGLRHEGAFRIMPEPVICTKTESIKIVCTATIHGGFQIYIENSILSADECARLAIADGFKDFLEMMKFWEGRLPFFGNIIHWRED